MWVWVVVCGWGWVGCCCCFGLQGEPGSWAVGGGPLDAAPCSLAAHPPPAPRPPFPLHCPPPTHTPPCCPPDPPPPLHRPRSSSRLRRSRGRGDRHRRAPQAGAAPRAGLPCAGGGGRVRHAGAAWCGIWWWCMSWCGVVPFRLPTVPAGPLLAALSAVRPPCAPASLCPAGAPPLIDCWGGLKSCDSPSLLSLPTPYYYSCPAQHELCETPEDFVARRTRLAFLDRRACPQALPKVGGDEGGEG